MAAQDEMSVTVSNNKVLVDTEPKRVKVYILDNNEWKDTGTGFCIGQWHNVNKDQTEGEAFLLVNDEENPKNVLLKSKLEGNIEYQRQEETLIVWKTIQNQDIALSFEESSGCDALCDFICQVQKHLEVNISLIAVKSNDDGMSSIHEVITGPVNFPSLDLNQDECSLMEALKILNENTCFDFVKNETINFIINSNYSAILVDHFHKAEKEHRYKELLILSNIVKTLILYNEKRILEQIIDDCYFKGIVGILEYDMEFLISKANHRKYLAEINPSLKQVIPLENNDIKLIIKKTFRLQFLKDVVLVRFLDENSFNLISELIMNYQSSIVVFLQEGTFIDQIMSLYLLSNENENLLKKREGIKLLHECVMISNNLESSEKSLFYKFLIRKGLFKVLNFAFNVETDNSVRILATDTIITIIEHDIFLINSIQYENKSNHFEILDEHSGIKNELLDFNSFKTSSDMSLLLILSKILLTDKSPGLKEQAFQALVTLLDPEDCMGDESEFSEKTSTYSIADFCSNDTLNGTGSNHYNTFDSMNVSNDSTKNHRFHLAEYFNNFYESVAPILFHCFIVDDFSDKDEYLLLQLIKLLNLLIHRHDITTSRSFVLETGILISMSRLMDKSYGLPLRLSSLRCIRGIIFMNDDFYNRYLIAKHLFDPIFEIFNENIDNDNMANSSILELFKVISAQCKQAQEMSDVNKNSFIILNRYLVERFGKILKKVKYVSLTSDMIQMNLNISDKCLVSNNPDLVLLDKSYEGSDGSKLINVFVNNKKDYLEIHQSDTRDNRKNNNTQNEAGKNIDEDNQIIQIKHNIGKIIT